MHTLQLPLFLPSSSMVRFQDGRIEALARASCSYKKYKFGLGPRRSMRYPDLMAVKSWRYIPSSFKTYNTFRVRYFTVIHLEELLQLGVLLCPINAPKWPLHLQVELDPTRWARAAAASSSVRRVKSYLSSLNLVPFGKPRFRATASSSTSVSFYQQRSQFAIINANDKKKRGGDDDEPHAHHDQRLLHAKDGIA